MYVCTNEYVYVFINLWTKIIVALLICANVCIYVFATTTKKKVKRFFPMLLVHHLCFIRKFIIPLHT